MKIPVLVSIAAIGVAGSVAFVFLQHAGNDDGSKTDSLMPPVNISPAEVETLRAKAESGDAAAQTSLAWLYQKGDGVKSDMKEAVKWFQRAADQNYPEALAALGEMTQAGQGVKANTTEAARLYRLAAEKGSIAGQFNLAYLYEQGRGVEASQTEAAKWYEFAAQGGDPIAQYDIGQRYMLGIGVGTNLVLALKWLTVAARQGQPDASHLLPGLKSQMTTEDIAKASQLAGAFHPHPASPITGLTN